MKILYSFWTLLALMLFLLPCEQVRASRYDYPGSFGPALRWNAGFCQMGEVPGVGDFNGDGLDDVVTFARNISDVSVALNTGAGGFAGGTVWNANFSNSTEVPLVGDFNGDGRADVASFNLTLGSVSVALSNGATGFAAGTVRKASGVAYTLATPLIGDFNGDHRDDVACV